MGPVERCLGPDVSAVQPWQFPLPAPPANPPNPETVADRIRGILRQAVGDQNYDTVGQSPSNIATLGELAFRCARTFRRTDYTGGCNGGRIRFLPQNNWTANNGISFTGTTANDRGIELLDAIKAEFPSISWSDLIVLAGEVAMEAAGAPISIADNFCPGRSDVDPSVAENSKNKAYSEFLVPFVRDTDPVFTFTYSADLAGLTNREMAVLMARPRGEKMQQALGFSGSWTRETASVSNRYFQVLLNNRWIESETRSGEYIAAGDSTIYMTSLDMAFLMSDELRSLADEYAGNNDRFLQDFAKAYLKVMTNDRFDGPTGNVCASRQPGADEPTTPTIDPVSFSDAAVVAGSIFGGLVVGAAGGMWYKSMFGAKPAQQDDYQSLNA
jgi:catalase (peroxidase I)